MLPRVLPFAVLGAIYTSFIQWRVACKLWPTYCAANDLPLFFIHPYPYQAVLLCSGFCLVFRLNQSLARFWEARTATQNMSAKWLDGIMMCVRFDAPDDTQDRRNGEHKEFARCIVHLASLLHAAAVHTLRGDDSLDTLVPRKPVKTEISPRPRLRCGMQPSACDSYERDNPIAVVGGVAAHEAARLRQTTQRVHLVLGWIMRLLVRRRREGGLCHDAPIVSRIYQVLSDGNLWFLTALKVCDTPFPFPYAQLNAYICYVHLALFPVVVADKIASLPLAAAVSFCAVGFLFGLNEVTVTRQVSLPTRARAPLP